MRDGPCTFSSINEHVLCSWRTHDSDSRTGQVETSGASVFLDPEQTISPCSTQLRSGPCLHLGRVEGGDLLFCVQ